MVTLSYCSSITSLDRVTKASGAVGGDFLALLILSSQSDRSALGPWGNFTLWWRLCCDTTLLLDSLPGHGPLTVFHSLSSGALQHQFTAVICFSIYEREGGMLQAVGNDIFQAFYIPSVG